MAMVWGSYVSTFLCLPAHTNANQCLQSLVIRTHHSGSVFPRLKVGDKETAHLEYLLIPNDKLTPVSMAEHYGIEFFSRPASKMTPCSSRLTYFYTTGTCLHRPFSIRNQHADCIHHRRQLWDQRSRIQTPICHNCMIASHPLHAVQTILSTIVN